MTEAERKEVINTIKKEIDESKQLNEKYEKLKKIMEDPNVIEYLHLLDDIKRIKCDIEKYRNPINGSMNDSLERRISYWFRVGRHSCDHKVWLYDGSFYRWTNFEGEEDYLKYNSEDLSDNIQTFSYNKYVCLECRKEIKISKSDWKNFEKTNIVLKNQDCINIKYYQDLYYQLLYHNYDFSDAQHLVIDEFHKNNSKTKSLANKNV